MDGACCLEKNKKSSGLFTFCTTVPFLYRRYVSSGECSMCGRIINVVDRSEADVEYGLDGVVSGRLMVDTDTPGGNLQHVPYKKPSMHVPTTVPDLCVHS